MHGQYIQILTISKIGWAEPSDLQTWSALPLKISGHLTIGYTGHLCFLPSCKYVENTLELTYFPIQQHTGPSCWGSLFRCEKCPYDIWGSWYTPSTPQGCWTYLSPFLWPLRPHSCTRSRSPSWYSWFQSGRVKINISGSSRGVYFLIPEFTCLMPWIPLVLVLLDFYKPLLQKLVCTPPLFPLPFTCFPKIES